MAEKSPEVKKALAMMAKRKKMMEAAGVPASQMSKQMAGISEAGTDAASSGRALKEQQNNQLAQELLKKQQNKIKGK